MLISHTQNAIQNAEKSIGWGRLKKIKTTFTNTFRVMLAIIQFRIVSFHFLPKNVMIKTQSENYKKILSVVLCRNKIVSYSKGRAHIEIV